jgi:RNA polymerase sigma factor for flagellar operon FliA
MKSVSTNSRKTIVRRNITPLARRSRRAARCLRPKAVLLRKPLGKLAAKRKTSLRVKLPASRKPSVSRTAMRRATRKVLARKPAKPALKKNKAPDIWRAYARSGQGSPVESQIVEQYMPLVKTVVGRLAMTLPAHAATEDLYSAGLVGLLNAVRRFNPSTGVLFETYARVRIRGSVFDELRRLDWVPRSVHDKARKVEKVMRKLEQKLGRLPTNNEMAAALKISEDEYEHLLTQIKPATFVCLDSVRSAEQEGEATQHEAVADASQPDPGYATARREMAKIIIKRLKYLPEVQRKVLALYYFEDLRLREIAEVFGVTESRISQIHAAAVIAIRGFLDKHDTIRETTQAAEAA